ncbi:hypothetical protein BV22DRAFT_1054397 [Leucogyrophana mollusca]|uniref:Uncharacterized protein n=1 Tax=Leucogyrophana mollusca TaxID=85980 RepID=A0ACB8BYW2_9AGAM|nr:hypothetical protein BV22DRAFT_1054397 [Leucogyrophana mollusca]
MTIILLPAHDHTVQDFPHECCASFVCDIDKENDILGVLRRDRRNIVLDSSYPYIAPHIVVSPPETCWEEFYAPFSNRVEPQSLASLVVPPLPPSLFHSSRPPALDTPCDIHSSSLACSAFSPKEHSVPRRRRASAVFSLSRFSRTVLSSSTERLIFRHVVDAIHRHRYKATVYEACEAAPAVCERFNSSNCATRLEQPFVWSDPAQALLNASRCFQGTVIFESDFPFNAPHIMISEIPPQNPWIAWGNSTNPQDFDCLSVFATCAPGLQPDIDNSVETLLSDCGANNEASACGTDLFSGDAAALASDNHSREASPWPATPPHGDELRSVHVHDSQDTWETGRDACSADADASLIWNVEEAADASCSRTMPAGFSQSRCETPTPDSDDEDEDGLPPFDDWYISVVERSKHIVG